MSGPVEILGPVEIPGWGQIDYGCIEDAVSCGPSRRWRRPRPTWSSGPRATTGVGAALKKAGIQKLEAERWDDMQEAIKAHAEFPNEVDPEPVISGNGAQPA
jgi:hypothetical protein